MQSSRKAPETIYASFSGPLPPPQMLADYNEVHSGLGEMIANLMVDEAKDRREIRRRALDAEIEDAKSSRIERRRGQDYGLVIGLVALAIGGAAALAGHDVPASFIGGGGVIGLVTVFITGRAVQVSRAFRSFQPGSQRRKKSAGQIARNDRPSEPPADPADKE